MVVHMQPEERVLLLRNERGNAVLPCFQENDEEYHLQLRDNEKERL